MPKILVIEDEEDILNLIKIILEIQGYEVLTACDGFEALERMKENPDLIILDIMMPEIDGWEVLDKIRKNENWKPIPVIVFTANTHIENLKKVHEKRVNDIIVKPFEKKELLEKIEKILNTVV
ncbi:response regulator [Methanotorris formicicus]|uniref:Response regulator receiver protein n=1 Tax=Methanotorris formicicus Mc-S-70 TaxID=647171 RepID=H1KZP0_9EURY|nr:response regulator [Methanotorris formicicus]EHP85781.1 response regulator receiver protein [Methanotorris formicicus Mc-S-70]